MLDLLVIGAGLAGLSAALAAAEAGLRVRVVAKGQGAHHWHTGAVDLLGYLPGAARPVAAPLQALDDLPAQHPYRRLGAAAIGRALTRFHGWLDDSGLGYSGATVENANLLLPSAVGAPRPTFFAPQAQRAGDLTQPPPLLIVGFRGLRDFFPHLIAENLTRAGHRARAELAPLEAITARRDANPIHLAAALDAPAARARLAGALRPYCRSGERVGLPAILGLNQHPAAWAELQERLAAPVFEIPTLPPSVAGLRLYQALAQRLQRLGVRVEVGMEAIGFDQANRRITAVQTATSARPLSHRAGHVLLATGGILGGGFNSDHTGRIWETVFDLPLTAPAERSGWFHHHFLHAGGHPIFSAGAPVNNAWQPVNANGDMVYDNLWAAGGVLAHADPIRERSLEGLAIATAIAAVGAIIHRP
ncbi:MAG: glycerol-3-phosphate dehydrogenase subunit GlpB [Caldilineaceae bacterium]|nr:glycerol-3-phosphate dehydrogenase subunit GlpB [Caldilineaceae bacterium]